MTEPTRQVPLLALADISVRYRRQGRRRRGEDALFTAVDGVSITVGSGEFVAVIGESGSGKSSLAMVAAGLQRADAGSVTIAGEELYRLRGRRLRQRRGDVQVVFQDPHGSLDPRQRVGEGLGELRAIHPTRSAWISDGDLLARVGLRAELLGRLPHQLSGGQAQRVAIARALLLKPKLLIADEPTSALDVSVQAQILTLLMELTQDDIGILMITHDLGIVRHTADRVYVMRAGRVIEHGETERVLTDPTQSYTRRLIAAVPGSGH